MNIRTLFNIQILIQKISIYRMSMFNPNKVLNNKNEKAAKKKALAELKTISESLIPIEFHDGDCKIIIRIMNIKLPAYIHFLCSIFD